MKHSPRRKLIVSFPSYKHEHQQAMASPRSPPSDSPLSTPREERMKRRNTVFVEPRITGHKYVENCAFSLIFVFIIYHHSLLPVFLNLRNSNFTNFFNSEYKLNTFHTIFISIHVNVYYAGGTKAKDTHEVG